MSSTRSHSTARLRIRPEFANPGFLHRLEAPATLIEGRAERLSPRAERRRTEVYRTAIPELPGRSIIVKRYRPSIGFAIKECFRASRAHRAFRMAERLLELGIATAVPVASVDTRRFGWLVECYLVTLEVADAEWLRGVRAKRHTAEYGRRLVREFGTLMARLHDAGFKHTDVTLSNFLVTHQAETGPRLVVIDVDALRPCRGVSANSAAEDLGTLFRRVPLSPREGLWLVAQYCRSRGLPIDSRQFARRLGLRVDAAVVPPARRFSAGNLDWHVRADVEPGALRRVLESPDEFLSRRDQQFKNSRVVTVVRVPALAEKVPDLVLRRLNYGKMLHRARDWLRPSRARRAFDTGLRLERARIDTPRVVAVAERRRLRWPLAAYLITEAIPGARTLARILDKDAGSARVIAERLASLLSRLHNRGYSHRDLKATNILFDHSLRPYLIDLDGVRFHGELPEERAIQDLSRLARAVSHYPSVVRLRREILRFVSRYCANRSGNPDPRRLAERIGRFQPGH